MGDEDGEVNLMWKRLKNVGKHTYNVFGRKYGTTDKFVLMAGTDKSKVDIKNLESGVKYDLLRAWCERQYTGTKKRNDRSESRLRYYEKHSAGQVNSAPAVLISKQKNGIEN